MKNLLAAALLSLSLSAPALANPHGIMWVQGKGGDRVRILSDKGGKSGGNLMYYGGPVIANAKVYAVFWGDSVSSETKQKVGPFFTSILDSTMMDFLREYDTKGITAVDGRPGTGQHIGRGSYGGSFTITPANTSTDLSDADLQKELEAQIAAGHLPPSDDNTLYMTYFPDGISISIGDQKSCSTFCAYHEGFKSKSGSPIYYGVMPVCGGFGCGFGSAWDNMSFVSSHECLEAVTDPFPTPGDKPAYPQAWNTTGGEEIADVCPSPATVTSHGLTSRVSQEWDNNAGACNPGPWAQNAAALASLPVGSRVSIPWRASWKAPAAAAW